MDLDQTTLSFSPAATTLLQCILAIVVFGVALELSFADFRQLLRAPRALFAGFLSQLVLLPLLTYALVAVADPRPSIALGLMMAAACPGGNMSNVLTHWSGGRTSVSMTLTTVSSLVSPVVTPLTFALLGGMHPATAAAMRQIAVPYSELVVTILIALVLPLSAGMWIASHHPALAARLQKPLKRFGLVVFTLFVLLAVAANAKMVSAAMLTIFVLVLVHNALALITGYSVAALFGAHEAERRAVTFETGIHNLALGMTLVFTYFQGLGGMALVLGWAGVWHLITGGVLARYWARHKPA
ncbi:MAG TPA: bile acid:sodium symporter family protein [Solimonas sp.]|nr:bile acid:sodium symporter family protein [Solimonas sp.]